MKKNERKKQKKIAFTNILSNIIPKNITDPPKQYATTREARSCWSCNNTQW